MLSSDVVRSLYSTHFRNGFGNPITVFVFFHVDRHSRFRRLALGSSSPVRCFFFFFCSAYLLKYFFLPPSLWFVCSPLHVLPPLPFPIKFRPVVIWDCSAFAVMLFLSALSEASPDGGRTDRPRSPCPPPIPPIAPDF